MFVDFMRLTIRGYVTVTTATVQVGSIFVRRLCLLGMRLTIRGYVIVTTATAKVGLILISATAEVDLILGNPGMEIQY